MKKLLIFIALIVSIGSVFADFDFDVPFDQNIVGDSFADNGTYLYESEWMTISNNGSESQIYTFLYSTENVPENWTLTVCDTSSCFMPNFPLSIEIPAGGTRLIHIQINVTSTDGFGFSFTFTQGDLEEPQVYGFTFNTSDNVGAENILYKPIISLQNYPNPFNPQTTISFETTKNMKNMKIEIYNLKGQKIRELRNTNCELGMNEVVWNGRDESGKTAASGIYLYKLVIDNKVIDSKRMIMLK
ncbi:MAG: T9SS type A sorting domain-containing protein [Candidatus Cloacimonetes bacterium]|nr:T9SS type A sorting domain-containing protein [Candidatus Cloacimonadota bacterium]